MTWVPHLEKNEIKPTDAWSGQTPGVNLFAQYRRACETVILAPGQCLVGQVFETKKPIWIRDTSAENYKVINSMTAYLHYISHNQIRVKSLNFFNTRICND